MDIFDRYISERLFLGKGIEIRRLIPLILPDVSPLLRFTSASRSKKQTLTLYPDIIISTQLSTVEKLRFASRSSVSLREGLTKKEVLVGED